MGFQVNTEIAEAEARERRTTIFSQAAYEDRDLPSGHLDVARLAILADALEDAGCAATEILDHLRGPGPHVRRCWPLDLILGRS